MKLDSNSSLRGCSSRSLSSTPLQFPTPSITVLSSCPLPIFFRLMHRGPMIFREESKDIRANSGNIPHPRIEVSGFCQMTWYFVDRWWISSSNTFSINHHLWGFPDCQVFCFSGKQLFLRRLSAVRLPSSHVAVLNVDHIWPEHSPCLQIHLRHSSICTMQLSMVGFSRPTSTIITSFRNQVCIGCRHFIS